MNLGSIDVGEPWVRGRAMIELGAHLDEFEPGLHAKVWNQLPTESAAVLDGALPTDWILASHTRLVIDGIVDQLGPRAPVLWSSLVQRRLIASPLMRGLVEVVKRLGGATPQRFLKALPRGWSNAYKGWCEVRLTGPLEGEPSSAEIVFDGVAPYLFEYRQHWIAIEGVLAGLVAAGGEVSTVEMLYAPELARITANVRW